MEEDEGSQGLQAGPTVVMSESMVGFWGGGDEMKMVGGGEGSLCSM